MEYSHWVCLRKDCLKDLLKVSFSIWHINMYRYSSFSRYPKEAGIALQNRFPDKFLSPNCQGMILIHGELLYRWVSILSWLNEEGMAPPTVNDPPIDIDGSLQINYQLICLDIPLIGLYNILKPLKKSYSLGVGPVIWLFDKSLSNEFDSIY